MSLLPRCPLDYHVQNHLVVALSFILYFIAILQWSRPTAMTFKNFSLPAHK